VVKPVVKPLRVSVVNSTSERRATHTLIRMRVCLPLAAALLLIPPAARAQDSADVSVASAAFSNGQPGGPILYFITLKNSGPGAASNVTFTDVIPPNTTFIAEDHPDGIACSSPSVGGTGTVSCTMPTLQNGANALLFIEVEVDAAAPSGTTILNTAAVASANDPNSANNSASSTTSVAGPVYVKADLSIESSGPAAAMAGTPVTYSVTVTNKGPADAMHVSFVDGIPADSTFISGAQTAGPAFTCLTAAPGGRRGMRCTIDTLQNGASATFTIAARVDPGCPTGMIANQATINSDTPDLILPNEATTDTAITAMPGSTADLSLTIGSQRSAPPGGLILSSIEVINTGPADATNVTLTYGVPPETTFMSVTAPDGATCSTPDAGGTGTVACSIPTLRNEQSMIFNMSVEINPVLSADAISETATVASGTADPDMSYNSATATVLIDAADLSITQTADNLSVPPGAIIHYTIHVANRGPASAGGVTVVDSLPPGAAFVSASASQGSCSVASCALGNIASGGSAMVTVTITAPATAQTVINSASVSSSTRDPSSKNNSAKTSVIVVIPVKRRSTS
jgi:uncharacterized repeat protein (TIGR01451 family)